jgi:hypothetical protein
VTAIMCWKCAELDRRIDHLRRMVEQVSDTMTIEAAKQMVEKMEAEKAKLHPE